VNLVLEGSVRGSGDRFKVTAQLIRTVDGFHLWSDSMITEGADPFAVQEAIARNVVRNLQGRLGEAAPAAVARSTRDPAAYQLYLEGRQHWNRRTADELRLAVEHFTQALAVDPAFARAELGLAEAYAVMGSIGALSQADSYSQAKAHALKALDLDPGLAEAYATLGLAYSELDWSWDQATEAFEKAITLKPGYATAHQWYAAHLRRLGRFDDAVHQARLARDLDPLSLVIRSTLGDAYYDRRDWDRAEGVYREMLRMDPEFIGAHISLAAVLLNRGRWDEAAAELRMERDYSPYWVAMKAMFEGRILLGQGDPSQARRVAADLGAAVEKEKAPYWMFLALLHGALGEADAALGWLDRALANRDYYFFMGMTDPALDLIRSDPRFGAMMERHGLPARLSAVPARR
jgi:tetratricopeptide (TPR) repeat protein